MIPTPKSVDILLQCRTREIFFINFKNTHLTILVKQTIFTHNTCSFFGKVIFFNLS